MIDGIDSTLRTWIGSVLGDVDVSLAPPGGCAEQNCISLHLLDLLQAPPAELGRSKYFSLSLRYLITAWHQDPAVAHRWLGELVFAAAEHADFELELEPLAAEAWSAFGAAPRPSFLLRVPLEQARETQPVRRITELPIIQDRVLARFEGVLLGPGDLPVVGARIEIPGIDRHAVSDRNGYFCLTAIPADPVRKTLRIRAKGRELATTAEHRPNQPAPVTIHLDLTEA